MLDPKGSSQSYKENGSDYIITANMLLSGFDLYTNNDPKVLSEPDLNLMSADYRGLPPTTIITAEFDPLRDEGETLRELMLAHGAEVNCERYSGVIHGFFQLSGVSESAKRCIASISKQIKTRRAPTA